jgi:hypothetical protein
MMRYPMLLPEIPRQVLKDGVQDARAMTREAASATAPLAGVRTP